MSRAWVTARLNGLGYTCFWIDPDKKQRQKTFNLKADAQVFRGKKQRELDTGTYLEAERGAETVVSLFERCATSRANVRRKVKGKIVVPALDEIRALIAVFDPRYVAVVWVMAGCGLRIAEAMGLCADQVDFRRGVLYVDRQVTEDGETESGRNAGLRLKMYTKHRDAEDPGRTVPLPRIVADVLRTHLDQFGTVTWRSSDGPVNLLFPNHTRRGLLYQFYFGNNVWSPALAASRVSFDRTHVLRHFFVSSLLADGVPITDVAQWLGHASPEITHDYYGHLMPDAPDRGRAAIDNAMAPLATVTGIRGKKRRRATGKRRIGLDRGRRDQPGDDRGPRRDPRRGPSRHAALQTLDRHVHIHELTRPITDR